MTVEELYWVLRCSILSVRDYSLKERENCFLAVADIVRMRTDSMKTLRLMKTGQRPNTENEYFRGLESELNVVKRERGERTALMWFAILEHQAEHDNKLSDEWVDQFYRKLTEKGVQMGQRAACFDLLQAEKVYREDLPLPDDTVNRSPKRRSQRLTHNNSIIITVI